MQKFKQFYSNPQNLEIARGPEADDVLVGFDQKEDALRALQTVLDDEDFPELQVAPASRL